VHSPKKENRYSVVKEQGKQNSLDTVGHDQYTGRRATEKKYA
jgi:molybdopterin-guanine dinucleotide biosynthesis protein